MKTLAMMAAVATAAWTMSSAADSTQARCDIYQKGEDHTDVMISCVFSQRQGHITITRDDGVTHDLSPVDDTPGNFKDQNGDTVYRESGLGDQGLIFRFPEESVYVYWSTAALHPRDEDNWTAPFAAEEYDATTRLRCLAPGDTEFGNCPAGILRMEDGQASIVIRNQVGEIFTINFMKDYVNATNREVEAVLNGDMWTVNVANGEVYEVPVSAIEGG